MKTLYIDCGMGAAGDMLSAALLELLPDPDGFIKKLNDAGIPGVEIKADKRQKCGITGTGVTVLVEGVEEDENLHDHHHEHHHEHDDHEHHHEHHHDHEHEDHHDHEHHHDHDGHHSHHHSGIGDIEHIVRDHLNIPNKVKDDILNVYGLIAEAESHVHNVPVTDIHFHEVGTMDAVADITAVCLLMNEIAPDEVIASPVHVGSGQVKCAHGILPVPAPATAYILQGIPSYGGKIDGELCTPTGAALLKHFVTKFGDMPVMTVNTIGYGMGKKDFPVANCVRVMLGESTNREDTVIEMSCNVDDMNAEEISYAMTKLFEGGALDVYTVPIGMKKGRPGTLIRVLCKPEDKDETVKLIFKHTSTIGIRQVVMDRYVLDRKTEEVETPYGPVRKKVSTGYGVTRTKYEYDDISRLADEKNLGLREMNEIVRSNDI